MRESCIVKYKDMKVKWRTHELILLTIAFIGFCLIYIWEHLTPEMTAINHQYIEVFGKNHLEFSAFHNEILPKAGLPAICYLA
ncbi:hypothetical protein [Mucilaginibacter flavus]|uniref:hypothetical protein n=1 Tax=Mucilaginibacter flavus TaxID=931504 RepID=UPI0025B47263|nr:hypothetical protein [Mucilaginibacter flavus]MDN3584588.1 hypothetical protein [Mucilaginibacter flavus]